MKLRNKKTGEIKDLAIELSGYSYEEGWHHEPKVTSIEELNNNWEDYKPQEPLIKAKEIREEIKLFAYRNEINCFRYQARNGALYNEADNGAVISLEVSDIEEVEHLVDGCLYTLEELCGEEEC